ncbi:MAG: carboxylesterase family protein, partial [Zwartia sp.]
MSLAPQPVTVTLKQGQVTGLQTQVVTGLQTQTVTQFLGLRYAQAPTGALRFAPPQALGPQPPFDATQAGPVCPQLPSRLRTVMGDFEAVQDEDCLRLAVWTPGCDQRTRPVVVWLHGGAWQSGGGALGWYDGTRLAARGDCVVVGVNYRLAALGWLYVPGETANVGLLDEEAAVRWVVDNIEHFGGDPTNIIMMGQSAGGFNIAAMLAREPLFNRAILQSASLGRGFRDPAQAAHLSRVFLQATGAQTVAEARALPVANLLAAQQAPTVMAALKEEGANRSLFCPVGAPEFFNSPLGPLMQQAATRADVLLGYTRDEMTAFPGAERNLASQQLGEKIFGAPSRQWAHDAHAADRQAWVFEFAFGPNPALGACHCSELPFVFGNLESFDGAAMLQGMTAEHGARLVEQMQSA